MNLYIFFSFHELGSQWWHCGEVIQWWRLMKSWMNELSLSLNGTWLEKSHWYHIFVMFILSFLCPFFHFGCHHYLPALSCRKAMEPAYARCKLSNSKPKPTLPSQRCPAKAPYQRDGRWRTQMIYIICAFKVETKTYICFHFDFRLVPLKQTCRWRIGYKWSNKEGIQEKIDQVSTL